MRLLRQLAGHWPDLIFTAALVALAVGLWWERPSLALVVPGGLVCGVMLWGRLRGSGGSDD